MSKQTVISYTEGRAFQQLITSLFSQLEYIVDKEMEGQLSAKEYKGTGLKK